MNSEPNQPTKGPGVIGILLGATLLAILICILLILVYARGVPQ